MCCLCCYPSSTEACVQMELEALPGMSHETAIVVAVDQRAPLMLLWLATFAGMGTAEWRAAKSPNFFTRGDYIPGIKVRQPMM